MSLDATGSAARGEAEPMETTAPSNTKAWSYGLAAFLVALPAMIFAYQWAT